MKSKLLASCFFLAVLGLGETQAQVYQAWPVTGYSADVIANGVGPSSTTTSIHIDGVKYNFIS